MCVSVLTRWYTQILHYILADVVSDAEYCQITLRWFNLASIQSHLLTGIFIYSLVDLALLTI